MADVVVRVCYVISFVLTVFDLELILAASQAEQHPAPDFSRHTLIKPRIYHGREKRQISTTKEEKGGHIHHLTIEYDVDGETYTLDLKLNRDLIPEGYFHRYQENGKHIVNKPTKEDVELCHYQGKIRGIPDSWAALSTCKGALAGVIYIGKDVHYVEEGPRGATFDDYHYLYKHSDIVESNKTCGYEGDAVNHDYGGDINSTSDNNRILRYKRASEPIIRGPYNANKQSRYVELVLVVDNSLYKELGENIHRVEQHCKDITNIINGLYSPLNIFVALVGVVTWSEKDQVQFSTNGDATLTNFLHYRRRVLLKDHPNDNAQLITKFNFDHGVVGKALKGPICTYEFSGGVNNNHSPVIGLVATTIAHEMGHNFGMEHDNNECICPDDRCIMAPSSSSTPPQHWSSCSLDYLAMAFEHGMDYCLRNKPKSLFGSPVCGNGFVEPGEQCDCGLPEHCDNSCCNAMTCTLNSNASCATGECCDLNTCKPKRAGTLCRSADIECDLPEYCTGQSEYCPDDFYKIDTEVCDGGKAYCYHGFCRSRSDQCKLLWGNTGKSSDEQCYKMNTKGTRHGNCGYNKLDQVYQKCSDEHILCGMLHCKHLNERLEFGMESVAILSHSFINLKGSIIPCRTALVDLGLNQVDPGLAPDGAKCGDGKMCVNQKCLAVDYVQYMGVKCSNCNGNGVCNNLGHCHCKDGFAPPFCDYPGTGGSEDSGPASDPNARKGFVTAMFIIFLGLIPGMAVFGFMAYYLRKYLKLKWNQSPTTGKSPSKSRGPMSFQPETVKRPTEDNHSLLAEEPTSPLQHEFFGHFKGFTISPKKTIPEPSRPAPPVPVIPSAPSVTIKSPNLNRSNTSSPATMNFVNKPVMRTQSAKPNSVNSAITSINTTSVAPALPPLNPGSHPRPIISSPILENSTCTAKELLSPLKNVPKIPCRPAPEAPPINTENKRPLSTSGVVVNSVPIPEEPKKPLNSSALNRIASFLKSNDKKPQVKMPQQNKCNKLDKNSLRSIEISNPIPQTDIVTVLPTLSVDKESTKAVIMRAQSMRSSNESAKPTIQSFGSMRQANGMKRPMSIPSGSRPKSPPPPRPPIQEIESTTAKVSMKIPGLPGYQKPTTQKQNQYDDCLNEVPLAKINEARSPSSDNIYAVIEETPSNSQTTSPEVKNLTSNSGSNESFGLLGEIVSEIQNRNFDSIYSTSTLARKKKQEEEEKRKKKLKMDPSDTYMNTSSIYKTPESVYSNMSNMKSSASSTSSGYINPSAVNPPLKPTIMNKTETLPNKNSDNKSIVVKPMLSTFKGDTKTESSFKPSASTLHRNLGISSPPNKNNTNVSDNESSETIENAKNLKSQTSTTKTPKLIDRQVTPPNLRTRKPSPTRTPIASKNVPKTTKTTSNSPDLVTSCSTTKKLNGPKPPDVLNGSIKKPVNIPTKPNIPKTIPKVNKTASLKHTTDSKDIKTNPVVKVNKANSDGTTKVMPSGARLAAKQQSNVASLQQKFENRPPISAKTVTVKK